MFKHALLIMLSFTIIQPTQTMAEASNNPTGLEIMQAVDNREDGDTLQQDIHQILIDRNGNKRERHMISFRKDYGKDRDYWRKRFI